MNILDIRRSIVTITSFVVFLSIGRRVPVSFTRRRSSRLQCRDLASDANSSNKNGKVAIVGSGLVGRSWAMLFASVGYQVMLHDVSQEQIIKALVDIRSQLRILEEEKLLRGTQRADEQYKCIKGTSDLAAAVDGVLLIEECIPENLNLKIELYQKLDKLVNNETILASSSSTFVPSKFSKELKHRGQVVISHPVNPPYYVPLVEIVPAPWTRDEICKKTKKLMLEIGQVPIILGKEIDGFILNRIQYTILNEVWRLVDAKYVSVEDIDKVMSCGLGMSYAFLGALETIHLNADGIKSYIDRYSDTIYNVSKTMGGAPQMAKSEGVNDIYKQMHTVIPLERLMERRAWCNACMIRLAKLKKQMDGRYKT